MMPYLTEKFGNPSSIYSYGRETKIGIENLPEIEIDFFLTTLNKIQIHGRKTNFMPLLHHNS